MLEKKLSHIIKRDGSVKDFDPSKIAAAIAELKTAIHTAQAGGVADGRALLQASYDRAQKLSATEFSGKETYTKAMEETYNVLQNAEAGNEQLTQAATALDEAIRTYLQSAGATNENPADFTAFIQNADLKDWDNGWTQANVMVSGDCKAWTNFGTACYNNWSDNFTSMDLYQDLEGLLPGWYHMSCQSLCVNG